ncbi:MAG TPA: UV DNA damage repair endonuclease UvsE [Ruminococcaceae bacterium]|nr:UV DNA damage repair endonuclease UvsE [Oscillospiraceae bacterium]
MSIGYACLAIAVPGSDIKSCTLKNANDERLLSLIGHNLDALQKMIDYNARNGIKLFRISSDLIPFGSSLAAELPWQDIYAEKLSDISNQILRTGMRVSMHPGQYTVLNSPEKSVVERAVQDLIYHAKVLDSLGLGPEHKLVLHLGGAYGDKKQAKSRFISKYKELEPAVQKRLVLENDGVVFNIMDVLDTAAVITAPVVYDNLHNAVNPADIGRTDLDWISLCSATWGKGDGLQKIHYSQQHREKKPGAHSESIQIDTFLEFYRQLSGIDVDIMLEVKDKNISALKCSNCASAGGIGRLEAEWARYKYCVLERSPEIYTAVRKLLGDKGAYPAIEMYRMIEEALKLPVVAGKAVNAAQHVWGYFKDKASDSENKRFQNLLQKFLSGEGGVQAVKNNLWLLAKKYQEDYLLNGYYFDIKKEAKKWTAKKGCR